MSKVSSISKNKVGKTMDVTKQSGSNEVTKGKRQCKTSKYLLADKENTPPVFTRSKSRTLKSANSNINSIPSIKTNIKQSNRKKNEGEGNLTRAPLKPVKEKPAIKGAKTNRMSLNLSPIHPPKAISNSGRNDLPPLEETEDYSLVSISHIIFRRRSSNTMQKETCILTSENPPLDFWKMLAEERLNAIEKTRHENELLHDQLSVYEAENSQLKEMLKQAKEIITIVQSTL